MNEILEKLSIGDLHSGGKSEEVALEIVRNPSLLKDLTQGLGSQNKVILKLPIRMELDVLSLVTLKGVLFRCTRKAGIFCRCWCDFTNADQCTLTHTIG